MKALIGRPVAWAAETPIGHIVSESQGVRNRKINPRSSTLRPVKFSESTSEKGIDLAIVRRTSLTNPHKSVKKKVHTQMPRVR